MAKKQIIYNIGFNVNNSNLKALETELNRIGNMSLKELQIIDKNKTKQDLNEIQYAAKALGKALEDSYNPKIDSVNIQKFNQSLESSSIDLRKVALAMQQVEQGGVQSFRNLTAELLTSKKEIKQTSKLLDSLATTFTNTVKWSVSSSALNMFTGTIQKAWRYSQRLDESLNNIRIVTGKSNEEMEKFAKNANKVAKDLKAGTTNYTNAALIYYQQGLNEEDVAARTNVTVKAANVTGQSASEVSEQLTAVWNGYKVVAEEAELYVDKLAAVAASTAADLEELSTGMSKVASAANAMGVDVDQLSAQLATIVSVTRQDASVVGTALKTIYSRMGDLQVSGVDEFGTSLGDVSGKLKQMGIDVLDQEGNLRDMGNVIEEVAKKWNTWTDAQQQAAAVAIAGKRQYNNLIALFENWDMYESAKETSKTSMGTLQKQQEIYADSIEAKLKDISTSAERVYDALLNSESMKDFLEDLGEAIDKFGSFTEAIGGGGNLLGMFGALGMRVFNEQITKGIINTISNLGVMKRNLDENRARFEILNKYKNILKDPEGKDKEVIDEMVSIREQELKYAKYLTEEEKEQLELNIKQTAEIANQLNEQQKIDQESKNFYKERFGKNITENTGGNNQYSSTRSKAYEDLQKQSSKITGRVTKNLRKSFKKLRNKDDREEAKQEIETKLSGLLKTNNKLLDEQSKKKLKILTQSEDIFESEKEIEKILEEAANEYDRQATLISKSGDNFQKLAKQQENVQKSSKKIFDTQKVKIFTSELINLTSSFAGMATGINMLSNAFEIVKDDGLNTIEKIDQSIQAVTTGIATAAPGVISSIKAVQTKGTEAGAKIQRAFGWISLAAMAITTIISIGAKIYQNIDRSTTLEKAQEQLDKVEESAEQAKNKLNELRSEYNGFMNEITSYKEARLAIDDMREGTEEWKQSVQELNLQVMDLITKYPELAKYMTTESTLGGATLYGIEQKGITEWLQTQRNDILEQNKVAMATNIGIYAEKENVLRESNKEQINDKIGIFNLSSLQQLSDEEIKKLIEDLEEDTNISKDLRSIIQELININEKTNEALADNQIALEAATNAYLGLKADEKGYNSEIYSDFVNIAANEKGEAEGKGRTKTASEYKKEIAFFTTDKNGDYWLRDDKNKGTDKAKENVGKKIDTSDDRYAAFYEFKKINDETFGEGTWESSIIDENWFRGKYVGQLGEEELVFNKEKMTFSQWGDLVAAKKAEKEIDELTTKGSSVGNYEFDLDKLIEGNKNQAAAYFMSGRNMGASWDKASLSGYSELSLYSDLGDQYLTNVGAGRDAFIQRINEKYNLGTGRAATDARFANFTESDFKAFSANISRMISAGFEDAAINELLNTIGDNPELNKAINDAMSKVTSWNDPTQVNELRATLIKLGVNISTIGENWDTAFNSINAGWKQWINNSKKVIENLATINNITKDLKAGDIISIEDFEKLATISPEIINMFIKSADGMVALTSGNQLNDILKNQYKDLDKLKTYYENINEIVKINTLQGSSNFDIEKFANSDASIIKSFFENEGISALATQMGITNINALLAGLDEPDDSNEYINASNTLAGYADQLNRIILDAQKGFLTSETAEEYWATSIADSWSEVDENSNISADVKTKTLTMWKNRYLTELDLEGIDESKVKTLDIGKLEKATIAARKLELDYLQEINSEIKKNATLMETAFGSGMTALLEEQIANQKDAYDVTVQNAEWAKIVLNTALEGAGFEEGTSLTELLNARAAIKDPESEEAKYLDSIIEKWNNAEDAANAVAEASQAVIDAQIENYNYQLEMQDKITKSLRKIRDLAIEFDDFATKGFSVFEEDNATKITSQSITSLSDLGVDLSKTFGELEIFKSIVEGNNSNNRFYNTESGTFNAKDFKESFEEALDEAHETLTSMREELQTLYDSYLQAQDEMLELYDKEIQKLSTINDIYSTMADLSAIVGENTSQYYSSIANNLNQSYSLAEQQYTTAQAEYNKLFNADGSRKDDISQEMYDKVADNLAVAANNLTGLAQQTLEAVANNFSAQIKEAVDNAIEATHGLNLVAASESWELANAANEGYLDEVNARYGMDQLRRKIQTSIDDTDNYAAQKKLVDLRAKQEQRLNDILEERGKLSQYELDRANAEYELTLKQIALEEAQQTANKMKLTRDASGNYTYQYVADQDAIAKAEEELAAAENNLYNIDKERNKSLVDEYYATMTEANKAIAEAMAQGDTERVERLREYYFGENGMIAGIQSELKASSSFLKEIGALVTGEEFSDNITRVADQITSMQLDGEDGLFAKINELIGEDGLGIKALSDATGTISELLNADGILQTVVNSVTATQKDATTLATEVTELSNAANSVINKLPNLVSNVKALADELDKYADKYDEWLNKQIDTTEVEANTEALGNLTRSINELKDTLDDGVINGSVRIQGWTWDETLNMWANDTTK